MKHANNPLNLQVGDRVTLKAYSAMIFEVTGFTSSGLPLMKTSWVAFRGVPATWIESVTRNEGAI